MRTLPTWEFERGSNEFKDHDAVIILGRDEPNVEAAEQSAMAIWYDTEEPSKRIPGAVPI